jgi:hypothetical protein
VKLPVIRIWWPNWVWLTFKVYQMALLAGIKLKLVSAENAQNSFKIMSQFVLKRMKYEFKS